MTGRITPGDGVPGYELRLEGHLDNHWYDWGSGLTMHHESRAQGGPRDVR